MTLSGLPVPAATPRLRRVEGVPGLLLTATVAAGAFTLHALPGLSALSPMILAISIAFHDHVGTPRSAKPGVAFSLRRVLRLAIILLGLQLTLEQVREVGATGLGVIALTLTATVIFTTWLGARLGVERKLAELIAAGTSI